MASLVVTLSEEAVESACQNFISVGEHETIVWKKYLRKKIEIKSSYAYFILAFWHRNTDHTALMFCENSNNAKQKN